MNSTEVTTEDQEETSKLRTKKDAALWLQAHEACHKKLGRLPSSEDMVDFALSKEGEFIKHFFPFDDVDASARKHWVFLAGCYTRKAKILFVSDPNRAPSLVRALHFVPGPENKGRVIATLEQVSKSKPYTEHVIEEAHRSLQAFAYKYTTLNEALKNKKLERAIHVALEAAKLLE